MKLRDSVFGLEAAKKYLRRMSLLDDLSQFQNLALKNLIPTSPILHGWLNFELLPEFEVAQSHARI